MIQPFIFFNASALVWAIDHALPVFIKLLSPAKLALADRAKFFADILLFLRHNFLIGLFNIVYSLPSDTVSVLLRLLFVARLLAVIVSKVAGTDYITIVFWS